MADEDGDILGTPDTCDEKIEDDNGILDNIDIEPEEIEEEFDTRGKFHEIEQKFARYERNYRIRRIRELTRAALIVKKKGRGRPRKMIA